MNRRVWKSAAALCVSLVWMLGEPAVAQTNFNPSPADLAAALDIPPSAIVSTTLVESPGQAARGVLADFGAQIPQAGGGMVALSSGTARAPIHPDFVSPNEVGMQWGTGPFQLPIDPPNVPGCDPTGDLMDLTELRIQIVIPHGVEGFSFDHNFFAADYPEWVCSEFNDGFVALVESPSLGALNVAFDSQLRPISLNVAFFAAGTGAPSGVGPLQGTGYEDGGATLWNTASVATPVAGETVTLRLFIYDAADSRGDSLVLLDNFRWIGTPDPLPTANAGPDFSAVAGLAGTASVALNGSGADPEGQPVTFVWTGPFGTAGGATPTVTLPVGTHELTLTVTDTAGGSASDTVTATVADGAVDILTTALATVATHDATIAALQAAVAALQNRVNTLEQALQGLLDHPIWNSVPNAGGRR